MCATLIKQKAPRKIKAHEKWKTTLMQDNIDWKYMYIKPIKLTNETKLREFQFKFLTPMFQKTHFNLNVK